MPGTSSNKSFSRKVIFGSTDPEHGWERLAGKGVARIIVEGGRGDIHLPPQVASLADSLAAALKQVAGE